MFSRLIHFLLLLGASSALPTLQERTCTSFVDNFDNLQATVGNTVQVGTYNGITYQAATVGSKSVVTGSDGGIVPQSGNNDAVIGLRNTLTQIGAVTLVPYGNILASPSKSFDLKSFYFGCGANAQQSIASVASACTISVTGFNTAGTQIGVATFGFTPSSLLQARMYQATLPARFNTLKNVTIGLAATIANPAVALLHLDNVAHCNNS